MPEPIVGYFRSNIDGQIERIECSPPSFSALEFDALSQEFKPTTTTPVVITGEYGSENVFPGIGVKLFHSGGGMQRISVPFHARRYTRGDSEWYLYRMLRHLGSSGLGELCINDRAYTNSYFVAGDGEVVPAWERYPDDVAHLLTFRRQRFHVRGQLHFIRGLPASSSLPAPTVPAPTELGASALGNNAGNYTAVGGGGSATKLGRYCDLVSVTCERNYIVTKIPRVFGVRIKDRGHSVSAIATTLDYRKGRRFQLNFRALQWAAVDVYGVPTPIAPVSPAQFNASRLNLEQKVQDLQVAIRDRQVNLAGNGCVFYDCLLQSMSIDDDPVAYSALGYNLSFLHSYNEVAFS